MKKKSIYTIVFLLFLLQSNSIYALKFKYNFNGNLNAVMQSCLAYKFTSAANMIANTISDTETVVLNFEMEAGIGAVATGSPTSFKNYASGRRLTATATITFDSVQLLRSIQRNSGLMGLVMHEVFHCLGVSDGVSSFNQYVNRTNSTFTGPKTVQMNAGTAPKLYSDDNDYSHFDRTQSFALGMTPCMINGGALFYTVLDLALLYDIGYQIPSIASLQSPYNIGFKLNADCGAVQYASLPGQNCCPYVYGLGSNSSVRGFHGNDYFQGGMDTYAIMEGYGGNDYFAEDGFAVNLTMAGETINQFPETNTYVNKFEISGFLPDTIYFGANDSILITSICGITASQLSNATITKFDQYSNYLGIMCYGYNFTIANTCPTFGGTQNLNFVLYSGIDPTQKENLKQRIKLKSN
jgi:hypothetical protein